MKKQIKWGVIFGAIALLGLTAALPDADARRGGGGFRGGGRGHVGISRNVGRIGVNRYAGRRVARRAVVGGAVVGNRGRRIARRAVVGGAVVGGAVVGRRYYGGVYYGHRRRYWRGRWWAYGVGSCWRITPAGYYVWICG